MLLGDRADHVFEKDVPVSGYERRGIIPVHLVLAVPVLVVVLVWAPTE